MWNHWRVLRHAHRFLNNFEKEFNQLGQAEEQKAWLKAHLIQATDLGGSPVAIIFKTNGFNLWFSWGTWEIIIVSDRTGFNLFTTFWHPCFTPWTYHRVSKWISKLENIDKLPEFQKLNDWLYPQKDPDEGKHC